MANILEILKERVLIGDGALSSRLYGSGVSTRQCMEEMVLTEPDLVAQIHREYVQAGATIIRTNTFGANRFRLQRHGLENRADEISRKAVTLAKQEAAQAFVAGSLGPLGMRPFDPYVSLDDQKQIFREQSQQLIEAGCDLLFFETFTQLPELLLALEAAKSVASVPVAVSLAISEEGRLESGETLDQAWTQLRARGADIVGINGGCGPQGCWNLLSLQDVAENDRISVYPNAGKPEFYQGSFNYAASPAYFAENLPHFVAEGARLIGGDYGTTPQHIAAMAAVVKELKPIASKKKRPRKETVVLPPEKAETASEHEKSILDLLKTQIVTLVELDSPKNLSMEKFLAGARELKEAGAAALTLADNSLAILRVSNIAAAVILREKVGITPMLHIACRDRNLLGLQSDLLGLGVMGFRHVLALTGDPAKVGDHPGATSVYDINSTGLLKIISGMNNGISSVGKNLQGRTHFVTGCAFNPNTPNIDTQLAKLEDKIKAGAQYVLTQPVFDPELLRKAAKLLQPFNIPVFFGVMPVSHSRNAEFLHNEVPGIRIPEAFREKLRHVDDKKGALLGLELAKEISHAALEFYKGQYVITPFFRYEISKELIIK